MTEEQRERTEMAVKAEEWLSIPERGSVWGMSFLMWSATLFGRGFPRLFLWPIAFYYYVASSKTRHASIAFQSRIRGRKPTRREVYRNILRFAQVALDRLFFVVGQTEKFEFERQGTEHLAAVRSEKKGAILIGSHLGSFSAMRGAGNANSFPINAIIYSANSKVINGVLAKFGKSSLRTIDISIDRVGAILKVRERVRKGEFVAVLMDRVMRGSPSVEVDFLGGKSRLSTGGFALAAALKCPVYLVFGLYRGGNKYELHCEPFMDRIVLPKGKEKQKVLEDLAQRYASRLEEYARKAPDNWFNFFDFWSQYWVEDIEKKNIENISR